MKTPLVTLCSLVVVAAIVGSFASVTVAGAASDPTRTKSNVSSSVTIRWRRKHTAFKGRVRSADSNCISSRLVRVVKVRRGPDNRIGTAVTDSNGRWLLHDRRAHGRYYARVPSRGIPYTTTLCTAAKSQTIRVV